MAVSHWAEIIETNVSTANNTSTVTLRVHLVTSGESYNYNEQLGNTYIYTPGENKFWRRYTLPPDTDTKIDSVIEGVAHNNDGSKTITWSYSLPTGISAGTVTGSGTATLTKIPRYTTVSFNANSYTETKIICGWATADTVDHIWYSINNGSSWTDAGSVNATSGSFTIENLTPGTSYNCKVRVRRKDSQLTTDSTTAVATTLAAPTQSLVSRTETSITMKWTLDATASYIWYTTNGNATNPTWVAVGSVNANTGTYTISGLTANQPYNIRTKVRRKNTSTEYPTSNLPVSTYNYPYVKSVSSNPLTIGNAQTLTVYNPLGRTATVYMKKTNTSGTTLYSGTTSTKGESATVKFTPVANTLYASIPNNQDATCVYYCTYSSQTVSTKSGTYKVKGTEIPTFTNFTFADTTKATFTGNNQVLVQGLSNLRVTIPVADKMVGNNSAGGGNYTASCDTRTTKNPVPYSANADVNIDLGTIVTSGDKTITVTAYDTRQLYKSAQKTVTVIPYAKPTISVTATRLNNFENQTTLKVNGIYNLVKVSNVEKNSITSIKYRYREVGTENWTTLTDLTFTTSANTDTTKKYTCSDVTLDLDNTKSFEIEIQTLDGAGQTTTATVTVNIGIPSFFIKKAGGFESNGASKIVGATEINGNTVVSGSHHLKINGTAASQPLRTRAIVGNTADGTAIDDLYVQYGANKPTYFGNTAGYYISADGGTYSGKAATATTATNATNTAITKTNPTSNTWYYPTFVTADSGNLPQRVNNGLYYRTIEGTTSAVGQGIIRLGNTTASGTAGNKRGYLQICANTAHFAQLQTADGISADRTIYMPNHNGTIQVRPTELYNNTSGTGSTITLSASSANYNYLEIFFKFKNGTSYSSTRVQAPNGKRAGLVAEHSPATNSIQLHTASVSISTTTVKFEAGKSIAINSSGGVVGYSNTNEIYIYKILGWL